MSIRVECEYCYTHFSVKDAAAGRMIKCKECGEKIEVPDYDEVPRTAPVVGKKRKRAGVAPKDREQRQSFMDKYGMYVWGIGIALFSLYLIVMLQSQKGTQSLLGVGGMLVAIGGFWLLFVGITEMVLEDFTFSRWVVIFPIVLVISFFNNIVSNPYRSWKPTLITLVGFILIGIGYVNQQAIGKDVSNQYYEMSVPAQ